MPGRKAESTAPRIILRATMVPKFLAAVHNMAMAPNIISKRRGKLAGDVATSELDGGSKAQRWRWMGGVW